MWKRFGIAAALILTACGGHRQPVWLQGATRPGNKYGSYSSYPETRWNADGRSMTLLNELRYTDPHGVVWIAPAGSEVDGASIPRTLWTFMGGPFEGKYRNASVLHDVAYEKQDRPWQDVDRMFYNAMRCSGVGAVEAGTMYYSLLKFGHHWKVEIRKAKRVKPSDRARIEPEVARAIPVNENDIEQTRDWIRSAEPSPEEIEQRAGGPH
ncbi:MAG: hypothetical protein QOG48_446 [Verrucomicrobiota bacterium]|jgi:hypothetical protein